MRIRTSPGQRPGHGLTPAMAASVMPCGVCAQMSLDLADPGSETQLALWSRRSVRLLRWFGPLLIVTGVLGFLLPPHLTLMSGATAYNVFHIVAGFVAIAVLMTESGRAAAAFNLGFGLLDLWQAVAGLFSIFPADLFALRPADHLVHVVVGGALVWVGARALGSAEGGRVSTMEPRFRA